VVHRDAPDVVVEQLAFPGVQAGPDLQAVLGQLGPDCIGRADGSGRAVKGGQEPIPGRLDLATTESRQVSPNRLVVFLQDAMPAAVTQFGRELGRVHDVSEQHRG
jgi:hypothetical protein